MTSATTRSVAPPAGRRIGDAGALGRFETFLASGVLTVLAVRAFLGAAGYPQVGGGGLHVAHVLFGGLLMGAAITTTLIYPGSRARMRAAVIGGVGFGLFIDEVGKFITKDVNYFYRPAVTIIYLTFLVFYVVVRGILLRTTPSDSQRLAIAAGAISDKALGQLTKSDSAHALALLDGVSTQKTLADAIRNGLQARTSGGNRVEKGITKRRDRGHEWYRRLAGASRFRGFIGVIFGLQLATIAVALLALVHNTPAITPSGIPLSHLIADGSSALSAAYVVYGLVALARGNQARALSVLAGSVMVTMLLTEPLVFNDYQFLGLVGVAFELLVYVGVRGLSVASPDTFRS